MATGRTVSKWLRFLVDDSSGTPREIPVNSIGSIGITYDETDVTAFQDAFKGYLAGQANGDIEIGGPFDTSAAVSAAASGNAPALSGSHTVLNPISAPTFVTPLGLCICIGIRGYWTSGDPVWGVVSPSATSGYVCTSYTTDGETYKATFKPYPGTVPAWGTAILT